MTDPRVWKYRDASSLEKWLRGTLYAVLAACGVALVFGYLEYDFLTSLRDGRIPSGDVAIALGKASDFRQSFIGAVQTALNILGAVLFLCWVHRVNGNVRALGAEGMRFTPGWAVGWYFVPVWNLWKPYGAMKEMWQASSMPSNWQSAQVPRLLGVWWGVVLFSSSLDRAAFRLSARAEELPQLIDSSVVMMASDAFSIPYALLGLWLVKGLSAAQRQHSSTAGH